MPKKTEVLRRNAPSLHVPEPPARPGEEPDFSNVKFPLAGELDRPDIMVEPRDIVDHAFSMIRVLDRDGNAVGPWDPKLDVETLKRGLHDMLLTRVFDDRMITLQRTGRISFYMQCTGEEAVSVAQSMALRKTDMMFPTYRQQGLLISRGCPLLDMVCQCLNNTRDNLKGHQLPVLYSWREYSFFTISGNLGTQYPQAVGWAMANAIRGSDDIAISWVGDGTTSEGDFHQALTFASVYRAPVVLCVTNNQWAISSYQDFASGTQSTFASRGIGYGLPGIRVDGNDFLAVYAATQWAAERARNNGGATLIELFTYRVAGHSTSDDPSKYRPKDEGKNWPLGDPIERLKQHLIRLGAWSEAEHEDLIAELLTQVKATLKEAETYGTLTSEPKLSPAAMFEDVFKEMPWHLRRQRQESGY